MAARPARTQKSTPARGGSSRQASASPPGGPLQRLVSALFGGNDPERQKRRLLKEIGKDLQRQRYRLYKPRSREVLPGLGRLLFEAYRVVGPAQPLVAGAESSGALRQIVVEQFHSEEQNRLREELNEKAIRERAEHADARQVAAGVRDSLEAYVAGFDATTIKQIDATYNLIRAFIDFARFDLYFVLRKLDPTVREGGFAVVPRFEPMNGEYVCDDIKDLLEVALPLDKDAPWDQALGALREYRSVDVVDRGAWQKLLNTLTGVLRSGVLVKIVQHLDGDPGYRPAVHAYHERIAEHQLTVLRTQVEATLQTLGRERRSRQVEELVTRVFGTADVQRARHYTEEAGAAFAGQAGGGFQHTEAVNYLKAYLVDSFRADGYRLLSDLLVVRARWSDPESSQRFSDALHAVSDAVDQVVEFDDSLGERNALGVRLTRAAGRLVDRDPASNRLLREALRDVNEQARAIVNSAGTSLVELGRIVKVLTEDIGRDRPQVVLNWRELEIHSEEPVKQRLVAVYTRLYYFVNLLQLFAAK